jgi:hypothetical protein
MLYLVEKPLTKCRRGGMQPDFALRPVLSRPGFGTQQNERQLMSNTKQIGWTRKDPEFDIRTLRKELIFYLDRFVLDGRELHCGDCFQVKVNGEWHDARIELFGDPGNMAAWYLVVDGGASQLDGLEARREP